jgi:methoxylated aromatic compound---corrinoid protein Co-methyltransferase
MMLDQAEELYQARLGRYVAAMRNTTPDRVPIRPFAAEVAARSAGLTCQDVTQDYRRAFEAVIRCSKDYAWDAAVPNMVAMWAGVPQAIGLNYFGIPGVDLEPDVCFQYREPAEDRALMKREEYDELIDDPTQFLYQTWLPRATGGASANGRPASYLHSLGLVKGAMALLDYFRAFGPQVERMRAECGMPAAFCGMLRAPLDMLADKFRGYIGLVLDLQEMPEKVLAACHALMPHLGYLALTSADPECLLPVPFWMHRGCTPFISKCHFETIFWPTTRPIVDALWAQGNQVLFYAEGKWDAHLERFAELPERSIIFHIDRSDPRRVLEILSKRFCLSGGVPNTLLAFGSADEVKSHCRRLIETIGAAGGYIMDAAAIMQNDTTVENLRAMTEATLEYGVYRSSSAPNGSYSVAAPAARANGMPAWIASAASHPGACLGWEEKLKDFPSLSGNPDLVRRVWEEVDSHAYNFIWNLLLCF